MLGNTLQTKLNKSLMLIGALSLFTGAPAAQAETYSVSARFFDGGIQGQTLFNGTFNWDGATLTSFSGGLTQSMWAWDEVADTYKNKKQAALTDLITNGGGQAPVLNLTYQLGSVTTPDANGDVLASVFLVNSTDVYMGGGYLSNGPTKFGATAGETANQNAFFTLAFNAADPTNTATTIGKIVYGDCTAYGLMMPMLTGNMCMTGLDSNGVASGGVFGSMGGYPTNLTIAAVPEPETYAMLLVGLGLTGFIARRRKVA